MTQPRCRSGFAQKAKPRRFITEIFLADDFQRHGAVQIDVEGYVSDPHRTAAQLDRFAVFARHQLVVLKSFWWLVRCRPDRLLERRLARLDAASKTLAKHADRTEFHRSRKLITAARAGALGLRAHFPNHPTTAAAESATALRLSGANSVSTARVLF